MSRQQFVTLIGCAILVIGLFVPIVDVPITGKLNYFGVFRHGYGAIFLMVLAVASAVLVFFRLFKILRMTGGLAFALIVGHMIVAGRWVRAEDAKTNAGFHSVLRESPWPEHYYRLQWGWAILIIGAVVIIAASLMKDESTDTPT